MARLDEVFCERVRGPFAWFSRLDQPAFPTSPRAQAASSASSGGSAFNIEAESLRLGDFRREDLEALDRQHTEATGQAFEPAIVHLARELTQGQRWLVNALAYEACFRNVAGRDRSRPITWGHVLAAREALIR